MDSNNVVITNNGKELPLPPLNPIEEGIVVPVEPKQEETK